MSASPPAIVEQAPAKANLVLRVGPPRADGLHPLCSIFAALDLADGVTVEPAAGGGEDVVHCPGVEGDNLALRAIAAYRRAAPDAIGEALVVTIDKRIPVAAGLGGGSADAAAVLRALDRIAGRPLGTARLRQLGAGLGADVPSQVEPRHALVGGIGELLEPLELPALALVLVPAVPGLSTPAVYAELDRLRAHAAEPPRAELDPAPLRALAAAGIGALAAGLENDLEAAAISLRPELAATLAALREAGALGARITGSGPTALGLFAERRAAEEAAGRLHASAIVTELLPS